MHTIYLYFLVGKSDAKVQLIKALDTEIASQKELVEAGDQFQPLPEILQEYNELLTNSKWQVR
jgi:hypothetical protein